MYHVNAQYIGPGMKDYLPRRVDFLHVRWFERVPQHDLHGYDALRFVELNDPTAFDFVDPEDILRGCHLLPAFRHGKLDRGVHGDHDLEDWKYYHVNRSVIRLCLVMAYIGLRYVDRDMLLRYHWGLGVGHTYSHVQVQGSSTNENQPCSSTETEQTVQTASSTSTIPPSTSCQPEISHKVTRVSDEDASESEFLLPYWDGEELEWEMSDSESASEERESDDSDDDDTRANMYAFHDAEDNYD